MGSRLVKVSRVRHMVPDGLRESLPERKVRFADKQKSTFTSDLHILIGIVFESQNLAVIDQQELVRLICIAIDFKREYDTRHAIHRKLNGNDRKSFVLSEPMPSASTPSNLVQVGYGELSDVTCGDVIVRIEGLEDFGRAVAARYVDDLVCSEFASLCQFPAIRFQPYLRLTMIDLLCVQRGAFLHGAILPLRTRMLIRLPFPMIFANQMQFRLRKMLSGSLFSVAGKAIIRLKPIYDDPLRRNSAPPIDQRRCSSPPPPS